ncbi:MULTISPECIES: flavin reductase family protein [unclassified Brevibacterium]|uniref:flavin reductase family protein n=1 Tax=unclassified Brevibacterium TaxID=2614124 RepID=UPI000C476E81|nr:MULTISPECIES: flavin reductase family protein [unclassified Brevibacterium]SMX68171.1 NADH-FMN oxidoreductase RutF, flavin reductase (DIM6/NTAB) family [Brevibacterium sp. 239c]
MTTITRAAAVSPDALRETFSHFPQGVALIGAEVAGTPLGLVASTVTAGVSLDPPLISVAVQTTSSTWPLLRTAPALGISLLGTHQSLLARQLASKDRTSRFAGIDPQITPDGALTIPGGPAHLWTRLYSEVEAGDHTVAFLEVLDTSSRTDADRRTDTGAGTDARIPAADVAATDALVFHRSAFKGMTAP